MPKRSRARDAVGEVTRLADALWRQIENAVGPSGRLRDSAKRRRKFRRALDRLPPERVDAILAELSTRPPPNNAAFSTLHLIAILSATDEERTRGESFVSDFFGQDVPWPTDD